MMEILLAIRNNNMRKIPNYDPSHVEHLKKLLRSLQRGENTASTNTTIITSLNYYYFVDNKFCILLL